MFPVFMWVIVRCPFNMSYLKAKRTNLKTEMKANHSSTEVGFKKSVQFAPALFLTIISLSSLFSSREFYHVEFGAGLKSDNLRKMDRCLHFSFVYLVTEFILALSKCRKKANQNSGILPSFTAPAFAGCRVHFKNQHLFNHRFSS